MTVYPRVCGGTRHHRARRGGGHGLSPRVRGNLFSDLVRAFFRGSIPACAGEPNPPKKALDKREVYPRVCGGTAWCYGYWRGPEGLSPRVRGNPPHAAGRATAARSIPACAGEPCATSCGHEYAGVYPRVCGGTGLAATVNDPEIGLSPRVRGNPVPSDAMRDSARSIPACAGEPHPGRRGLGQPMVYPRVCGGTALLAGLPGSGRGLSPRVRGNQRVHHADLPEPGSIPACAGEPAATAGTWPASRVYPRVCGGTRLTRSPTT